MTLPNLYLPAKGNHRNTRTRFQICSKLAFKSPEQRQWHRSGISIVNFEHAIASCVCYSDPYYQMPSHATAFKLIPH